MSHARSHYLRTVAEKSAMARQQPNEFGDLRDDVSVYQLQLAELKNDKAALSHIKSDMERAKQKAALIPKYWDYVAGILQADQKVNDDVVTTIMLWCFDAEMFGQGLTVAAFALKHGLSMPDNFSRDTASIVAEELANCALRKIKSGQDFDLDYLLTAEKLTEHADMHDQIRAKLAMAIGKLQLSKGDYNAAVEQLSRAITLKDDVGAKTDLKQAEKMLAKQTDGNV